MSNGQRLVAIVLVFIGLYVMVSWGFLGNNPVVDALAKTASNPSKTGTPLSNAPLNPGLFGVPGAKFNGYGEQYSADVNSADRAGLASMGSTSGFAHDFDFNAKPGTAIKLPGSSNTPYTYLGNYPGLWGNLIYFRTPNGGIFGIPHLVGIPNVPAGTTIYGNTFIGYVADLGKPNKFWSGPHLAVITDRLSLGWFNKLGAGL